MDAEVLFAGVPVADLDRARPWYESLFGRAADIVPNEQEVMWKVVDGGWLYVVEDAERAGGGVVTVSFSSLDDAVAGVTQRGLRPGPIQDVADAGRKAILTDPDGNVVSMIEVAATT
ncbi:MAG TPA: hypothetical protein VGI08_12395 [Diaminobutyricibacter sp.]